MVSLSSVHARLVQILSEMPKSRFDFRPPAGSTHDDPPTEEEIFEAWMNLDRKERVRIDRLVSRLALDWHVLEEDPETWFLVEQRVRAAVFFLEHMLRTLSEDGDAYLPKDHPDDTLQWALVKLWPLSGPYWCRRAARLLAAGKDLSSRDSP